MRRPEALADFFCDPLAEGFMVGTGESLLWLKVRARACVRTRAREAAL
jgi:hypothetical protein